MILIRSRLDQPLLVHRGKASPLHLLAHGAAVISDQELKTPQLQALIATGAIESKSLKAAKKKTSAAEGPRTGEGASSAGSTSKRTGE